MPAFKNPVCFLDPLCKPLYWAAICVFSFLITPRLKADTDYYFHQINIEKGLSHSTVNCIFTDSQGMMWIGTSSGLNKFDRYEIKSYFYDSSDTLSLPDNQIYFIVEDSLHTLWIGTNQGLVRYNKEQDNFTTILSGKPFYSCRMTEDGIVFGGNNALYRYIYKEQNIVRLPVKGKWPANFSRLFPWKEDTWLISDRTGSLWRYQFKTGSLQKVVFCNERAVSALFVDREGNIYVAPYQKGLFCYDKNGTRLLRHLTAENSDLTHNIILDIQQKDGQLWLATDGGGINILYPDGHISSLVHEPGDAASLPVNSIKCLYKDESGNMWAGTVRGGVFGIKEVFIRTYQDVALNSTYGLSEKAVISLFEDKEGILWIGTDGGGINRYNPYTGTFKHYPDTYNQKIVSLTDYSEKELLACLYGKPPYLFNKQTGRCRPFIIVNPEITRRISNSLYITFANRVSDRKIYILSSDAYIYDTETDRFTRFKTQYPASDGFLLIGNNEEAAYLIRGNRLFEICHRNDSLSVLFTLDGGETIKAACRDKSGKFWIGTDKGLSCYDSRTREYKQIPTSLFTHVSTLLIDDKDRLWIGAQNMLFSYHLQEKRFVIWGESDGFLPNELPFAYPTTSVAGNIYFGGVYGLVKIKKDIPSIDGDHPAIALTDVLVDGRSVYNELSPSRAFLRLPWNYSSLTIRVVSKEKDVFRKKVFKYNIIGTHNRYSESYSHALNLRTLAPGDYSINVSCNTKNGDWIPSHEVLRITVTPPWYQNIRILLGISVVVAGLFLGGILYFVRRREAKTQGKMKELRQKMNEEKIRFLIHVSHELRTPLTLIYAPLKRLLQTRKQLEPDLRKQLTNISVQAGQMRKLINMTLDVNKINEGEWCMHAGSYRLNDWVLSVAEEFRNEFEASWITLAYRLHERIESVPFDASKCRIVLSNLLMNALKFGRPGTQVTVCSEKKEDMVRVEVADEGIGLGNVDMNKLFTPFYQGTHTIQGSGIGLSYAKALVEMHGGILGAYGNEAGGATFYFELPLTGVTGNGNSAPLHTTEKNDPVLSVRADTVQPAACGMYTVLVVEDNHELRTFLKEELSGFKSVYTAENGMKALELVETKQPDIIVSDIMMPVLDGYELCKRIKEDIRTSHVPVILLTARNDTESTLLGYGVGADVYLGKPFDMELLISVIRNQLRNRELVRKKYMDISLLPEIVEAQPANIDETFLLKLSKLVHDNLDNPALNIAFLTDRMAMSKTSLYNKIKALTDMGANDYINRIRIEVAAQLLIRSELSITEISERVGFAYPRYFSTAFKQVKGVTPTQFRGNPER